MLTMYLLNGTASFDLLLGLISNRVSIFSIQSYKMNLKNLIDNVVKLREAGTVILNKTQTRISETKEV